MADVARAPQVARTYAKASGVLVIGLGRLGSAIASALGQLGQDVLAVQKSPELVAQWAGSLPLVEADCTNPAALEALGARYFPVAAAASARAGDARLRE